ncbi:MAG: 50S ribosomal protein L17 [Bryobacteraceae bacterium]
MTSLIINDSERIVTTVPKAKAAKPLVDNMVTLAKRDTLHSRRQAASLLMTPAAVKKLFDKIGPRFSSRHGGYTRIVRIGPRKGDGAEQCLLELVGAKLVRRADERRKRKEERKRSCKRCGKAAGKKAARLPRRSRPFFEIR